MIFNKPKALFLLLLVPLFFIQCPLPFLKGKKVKSPWQAKAPMPTRRALLAVACVNGKLYAIGGAQEDNRALAVVEEYSPDRDKWRIMEPMPTPRADLSVEVVDGLIYAVGGYDPDDGNYYLNNLEVFDPVANTWTKKKPMPTRRSGLGLGEYNGRLYAIGGNCDRNWETGCLYMVEEYDPRTDTWTQKEALPTPRSDLAIAVVKNKIYAIGGAIYDGGEWYYFNNVEEFDPGDNTWKNKTPMPTSRCDCGTAVVGGKVLVIGGICNVKDSKQSLSLNDVEIFYPDRNRWSKRHPLPSVRYSMGVGIIDGKVYVVGGISGSTYLDVIEVYTP